MALSQVSDLTIFNTDAVKMLIEYKWRRLAWYSQGQCYIFMTYLVALMVHANDYSSNYTIYPLILYGIFFTSVEIYSIKSDY